MDASLLYMYIHCWHMYSICVYIHQCLHFRPSFLYLKDIACIFILLTLDLCAVCVSQMFVPFFPGSHRDITIASPFTPTQWRKVFERWPCYMKSNVLNVEFLDHKTLDLYFHHRFKGRYLTPKGRHGQQRAGVWKWDVDPPKTSIPLLDVMEKWIWAGDL